MADEKLGTLEDYLAKLNIEGQRGTWEKNRRKINFVLHKAMHYLAGRNTACDIGIGDGYTIKLLANLGLKVTGVDVSRYLIEYLNGVFENEHVDVKLVYGDISCIDMKRDVFDIVTCLDILEHIPKENLAKAITNIQNSIVNKGILIGTLPLGENLEKNMVFCPKCGHKFHRIGHYNDFSNIQAVKILLGSDFRIVKWGLVPLGIFSFDPINFVANFFYRIACKFVGFKQTRTVYFIAELNKG